MADMDRVANNAMSQTGSVRNKFNTELGTELVSQGAMTWLEDHVMKPVITEGHAQ